MEHLARADDPLEGDVAVDAQRDARTCRVRDTERQLQGTGRILDAKPQLLAVQRIQALPGARGLEIELHGGLAPSHRKRDVTQAHVVALRGLDYPGEML